MIDQNLSLSIPVEVKKSPGINYVTVNLGGNEILSFTNAANWTYHCSDGVVRMTIAVGDNNINL